MCPLARLGASMLMIGGMAGATGTRAAPPPDTIYVNANVHTVDSAQPRAEAIGVAGDRIVAVGSAAELRRLKRAETRVVDLGGATVLPGLIDAHAHVAGLGSFGLGRLDLSAARSFDDVVAAVRARGQTAAPDEWILGGRWDHEQWPDKRLPTHEALTATSPDRPVWLRRVDGHAGIANAAALRRAGITRATPNPDGGEIQRLPTGEPSGLLVDNAMDLIEKVIDQALDPAALVLKAQEMCLSAGLTGVHDAGVTPAEIEVYQRLAERGALKLRIYAMVAAEHAIEYFEKHEPRAGERLTVRAAKVYADGALGSRGAWLLEPYSDRPADEAGRPYTGLSVTRGEFILRVAEDGLRRGYQVCTHAIGDRGNREALNAYALALSRAPRDDHRFRVEHAQVISFDDVPRFARLGVIASMQPTHCTSDMRWVEDRIGPQRARGAYAWASLLRGGARVAFGSDFPVESHNPLLGLYAAVTRQDLEGRPRRGWQAQERLTREEALRAFTLDAAYAAFEEALKGSLTPGKLADFVVLDRDVMTCEAAEIPRAHVRMTVVGGEVVYRREAEEGSQRP